MLKIKDNVDLKELEKFGFHQAQKYAYGYYFRKLGYQCQIAICRDRFNKMDRQIFLDCYPEESDDCLDEYVSILFDLIQAGLVEKVD